MATRRIGITLSGDMIPLSLFLEASRGLNALLSEIDVAISGSRNLEWTIENLSIGSANLAVTPSLLHEDSIDQSALVISSALLGMEKIEKGGQWPEHFTETALLKAKEIVSIINGKVERVALFGNAGEGSVRVRVTQRVAANVDQLVGTSTTARGALEGTLETITIHGGAAFNIYDVITARRIRCMCDRRTLNELTSPEVIGKRILVDGEIRFNLHGQPVSIKVAEHRLLRDRKDLPQAKDIRGLFSKHKVDTEELSEYLRN